ncbi:Arginine serine-rich-splicing factor rsp40-like, partial [Globisporangium splendens]
MAKIYVGNLTYEFEPRDLEAEFARVRCIVLLSFGTVEQCAVKRGFAFIHFQDQRAAEAAVQEMDNYEWRGRRMRVAFATSTGESDRRSRGNDGGGGGRGGGDSRSDGQVSQNLFVANIPPHIKMRELEEFFEQFGKVENVKILPQARGNQAMSAFVDFSEVVEAQKAHESELVLDGHRLRSDYNIRRGGERRRDDYDRGGDRRQSDYDRHGSFDDNRRAYSSRGQRSDRYSDYDNRRGGNNYSNGRRDRSRSPVRQSDRRDDRRVGYGDDDRYASRRDRSPRRDGSRGDRDFGRNDDQQERRSREPRSPPRNNGPDDYKSGSVANGSPRRNERSFAEGEWHGQSVRGTGADGAARSHAAHADAARRRLLAALGAGDYIMVIGPLQKKRLQQTADTQLTDANAPSLRILAHQIVQLDTKQQREPMWFLEVIEYWTSVVAQA